MGTQRCPFFFVLKFLARFNEKNSNNLSRFLKKTYTFACLKRCHEMERFLGTAQRDVAFK